MQSSGEKIPEHRPVMLKHGDRIALCEHYGPSTPLIMSKIGQNHEPFPFETDRGLMMLRHVALCDKCWKKAVEINNCGPFLTRHARYEGEDYMPERWTIGTERT